MNTIKVFNNKFRFLSNFYPCKVKFEELTYPTAEHAFQAAKSLDTSERMKISILETPGQAKRAGRKVSLRPDWEQNKILIMDEILHCKFNQNPDLKNLLLQTNEFELIEGNNWGDVFWGMCNGSGRNELGKALMRLREEYVWLDFN